MSEVENSAPSLEPTALAQEQHEHGEDDTTQDLVGEKPTNEPSVENLIKKIKLKIDGEEFEEDFDPNDLESVVRDRQLARAARKRMAEAQDEKRRAFEIINQFDKDPISILKRLGEDGVKAAESLLLEKIRREQMSPEQIELEEMRSKLERYQAAEKEAQQKAEAEKQNAIEQQVATDLQNQIIQALSKTGIKSPNSEHIKGMAALMYQNNKLGLELNTDDLAQAYMESFDNEFKLKSDGLTGEALYKMLGKKGIKELNAYMIEQAKGKQKGFAKQQHEMRIPNPKPASDGYMTPDEWLKQQRERIKELKD